MQLLSIIIQLSSLPKHEGREPNQDLQLILIKHKIHTQALYHPAHPLNLVKDHPMPLFHYGINKDAIIKNGFNN